MVKEIFGPTIQGEGSRAGEVVYFVRFAGCNRWNGLDRKQKNSICASFCDTDFVGGNRMTAIEIVDELLRLHEKSTSEYKSVVLSGGEPMLQVDVNLIEGLHANDYFISIETNGSVGDNEIFNTIDHISCSPKQNRDKTAINFADDLKILYPYIGEGINPEGFKDFTARNFYLQPINYKTGISISNVNDSVKEVLRLWDYKLCVQQHKIIDVR